MLNYVITVAISAFFVPHYLSIFWEPLKTNPWDIIGGIIVVVILVGINIVGIQEAARVNIVLAVVDFATQLLLVLLGFILVLSPHTLSTNIHFGTAPTWSQFLLAIPVGMIAYTGIETVSNLAEEARDPVRTIPRSISMVAIAVFAIYFTLPLDRALGAAGRMNDAGITSRCSAVPATAASRTIRCSASSRTSACTARCSRSRRSTSASSPRRSSSSRRTRA